jgi:hypothetical protein
MMRTAEGDNLLNEERRRAILEMLRRVGGNDGLSPL